MTQSTGLGEASPVVLERGRRVDAGQRAQIETSPEGGRGQSVPLGETQPTLHLCLGLVPLLEIAECRAPGDQCVRDERDEVCALGRSKHAVGDRDGLPASSCSM